MRESDIIYIYMEHVYNKQGRIGCEVAGKPVIFSESKGSEDHYGNLEYAVQQSLKKGIIHRNTGIVCRIPDSKPDFEHSRGHEDLFFKRRSLNDSERKVVEEVFSRYRFD